MKGGRLSPPKKRTTRDVYYDVAWQSQIKAKFDAWWEQQNGTYPDSAKFHQRTLFVSKEYENEPVSFQEDIKARVEADHKSAMEEWKKGVESLQTDNMTGGEE